MKKFIIGILVLFLFTIETMNVQAKTVSWDDIGKEFIDNLKNASIDKSTYNFEYSDESLVISYKEDDIVYNMILTYNDNSISYINVRDVSNLSDEYRVSYALFDTLMISTLNLTLINLYNPNMNDLEEITNLQQKLVDSGAITVIFGDEVKYSSNDENLDVNLSATEIKNYKIDLVKVDNVINDKTNNITTPPILNEKEDTIKTIENPKTLDMSSSKYLLFIAICIVGICGLIYVFCKTKKAK